MLSAFPIAMGIFAVTISGLKTFSRIDLFSATTFGAPSLLYTSVAALLFLFGLTSVIVLHDFTSRPVGPYILRKNLAAEAFRLEKELRAAAKTVRARRRRRSGTKATVHKQSKSPSSDTRPTIRRYQSLVQLKSLRAILEQGNFVAAAYLVIAWIGCLCVIFYFWYVAVLVLLNQKLPEGTISKLLTVFVLLVTWLPMRVHMDWYQNYFHNPKWLIKSNGFFMGIVMAAAGLGLLIFITKPEAIAIVCAVVNALVLLFVGVAGRFKPEWLRALADAFQAMPFVYFLAAYIIFFFVTVTIGIRILNT
jgi:hypothetical protein